MGKNKRVCLILSLLLICLLMAACSYDTSITVVNLDKYPVIDGETGKNYSLSFHDLFQDEEKDKMMLKDALAKAKIPLPQKEKVYIYLANGDMMFLEISDSRLTRDGRINNSLYSIENIAGIVVNPPDFWIGDAGIWAENFLQEDQPTLFICLDGLNYDVYQKAKSQGLLPFMSNFQEEKAIAVHPSFPAVSLAALISGKNPAVTNITKKDDRQINCPTIFDEALKKDKKICIIQSEKELFKLPGEVLANQDSNNNGTADDEIFRQAVEKIDGDYDLIFVDFSGIAEAGNKYGYQKDQYWQRIKETDAMIRQLAAKWEGKIIIASPYGQDGSAGLLNEGEFLASNMLVPIMKK